jgi:hypothetical protein
MHAVTLTGLEQISRAIALRLIDASGVDISSVALDMTNFATFIATANEKAPIAQRGKAKQKRADLRLVGLGSWSPATAASHWPGTPTPVTGPTSPSSRR